LNVGEKDDESYLIFVSLDMGQNLTMFMRQANQNENCHVGNSYHAFSVFGQKPILNLPLVHSDQ